MTEQEPNQSNQFIQETVKQRPLDRKKLLRKTLTTALMAVLFGLIACLTFLFLEPLISKKISPEVKPQMIFFPEDADEMAPKDMLAENIDGADGQPALEEEKLEELISSMAISKDTYKELYAAMADYIQELKKYMVTVTAISTNVDWFSNLEESLNQVSGLVLLDNGVEILILADASVLENADSLVVTFYNNSQVSAQVKQMDPLTNLAILAVPIQDLPKTLRDNPLTYPVLGSSNNSNMLGMPVVAMGSPVENSNSIGYGMIISSSRIYSVPERNYKMIQTNIQNSSSPNGVLFDLEGRVIGIITSDKFEPEEHQLLTAYGITELRKIMEKLSNAQKTAYLGISGITVPREASSYYNVPLGAYVNCVDMDSPAMRAGVQQGDIISNINGRNISTFTEYTNILMGMEPGADVEMTIKRRSQDDYKEIVINIQTGEIK